MKKLLFLTLIIYSTLSYSQSYEIKIGYGLTGLPSYNYNNINHIDAGFVYNIDDNSGIMIDLGIDKYKLDESIYELKSTRISAQYQYNIGNSVFDIREYDAFQIKIHAGGGVSFLKSDINNSNTDNVVNVIGGITPSIQIIDNLGLYIDVSSIFNLSQHYNFDGNYAYTDALNSFTGIYYNTSFGINYKF